MKHIVKGNEPLEYTEWKNKANDDWRPTYSALSGDEKKAVLDSLKSEQGYICCYCEGSLVDKYCHIEHLKPQHLDEVDPLDFSNMLCSCQVNIKKGEPINCGNSKNGWYDEALFVSPLDPACETKFKYTFDGRIMPMLDTDLSAITTIDKLQLQIDKLNALRSKAIEPFLDQELSEEDVTNFANGYLEQNNQGRFNQFYTTIKYLFFKPAISNQ